LCQCVFSVPVSSSSVQYSPPLGPRRMSGPLLPVPRHPRCRTRPLHAHCCRSRSYVLQHSPQRCAPRLSVNLRPRWLYRRLPLQGQCSSAFVVVEDFLQCLVCFFDDLNVAIGAGRSYSSISTPGAHSNSHADSNEPSSSERAPPGHPAALSGRAHGSGWPRSPPPTFASISQA
jgi:hypothetical protein